MDKLEFIQHVLRVPSEEGRNAELALYRKCPDEAEAILLQASPPLVYRAIKLNVSGVRPVLWSAFRLAGSPTLLAVRALEDMKFTHTSNYQD